MGPVVWIIIGVAAGGGMTLLYRRGVAMNLWANLLAGLLGAGAGGFSANLVTRHPVLAASWESVFVACLGTGVFLAVANAMQRR